MFAYEWTGTQITSGENVRSLFMMHIFFRFILSFGYWEYWNWWNNELIQYLGILLTVKISYTNKPDSDINDTDEINGH